MVTEHVAVGPLANAHTHTCTVLQPRTCKKITVIIDQLSAQSGATFLHGDVRLSHGDAHGHG